MDIGVGMLGQGFMGRAHALAIGRVATFEGLALRPRLVAIAGRDAARLDAFAERFGAGRVTTDWRELIAEADESVWRFDAGEAGSGALGDLASHVVDLARFLVGEIDTVGGLEQRFVEGRAVDDAVAATLRFAGGAVGTLEATRFATGNANRLAFEINGARGALRFDLQRLN